MIGFLLFWVGFFNIFDFIPSLFRIIPFVGVWIHLLGSSIATFLSLICASVLTLLVTSIAWLYSRPRKAMLMIGTALVIVVGVVVVGGVAGKFVAVPAH